MVRLAIIVFLFYCLYLAVKGLFWKSGNVTRGRADGMIDEMEQDPYCKTYIPHRGAVRRVLGGREIFFCSKECADKFESENRI